jgi:diamine N-acetyltransferase
MAIALQSVTKDNLRETMRLMTSEAQFEAYLKFAQLSNNDYVAANLWSMAEAAVNPLAEPRAIYADDTLVGFLMIAPDTHEGKTGYYIWRLMIDYHFQRKGYGKAAMQAMIAELESREACQFLSISVVEENTHALSLYKALGFVETGEMEDDEIVLRKPVVRP